MPDSIEINLYCDEIKESTIKHHLVKNEKWIYLGLLIVPSENENDLINKLLSERCIKIDDWRNCEKNCSYHTKNNKEVHYQKLDTLDRYFIAERWIKKFLLNDLKKEKPITYFYILGINLSNLDYNSFGDKSGYERFTSIYNRFFRMGIKKSIKSYFSSYSEIIIKEIFHDYSGLVDHDLFPWHSIYKLRQDEKIKVDKGEIVFLDSNHKNSDSEKSHLIQFIDLILGLTFNSLHFNSDSSEITENKFNKKNNLTLFFNKEILKRVMHSPGNINSKYNYVNRLSIDFFPKHNISNLSEFERKVLSYDSFYKGRDSRIEHLIKPPLFKY